MNTRVNSVVSLIVLAGALTGADAPRWEPLNEPGCGGWITSVSISPSDGARVLVGGDMLGIGLSTDRGEHWQPTFGLRSWEIGDFTWHPRDADTVWVGTMSGPYVSHDGGRNWLERRAGMPPLNDGCYSAPIEKLLFDPGDARHLLAFGGSSRGWESSGKPAWGAVWESRDDGATWKRLSTLTASGASTDANADGRNIVAATFTAGSPPLLVVGVRSVGVFASSDLGASWTKRNDGLPAPTVERVIAHPRDRLTWWACVNAYRVPNEATWRPGGVFKTSDGGVSWTALIAGLPEHRDQQEHFTAGFKALLVSPSDPQVMFTDDLAWNAGVVYGSGDGGALWKPRATRTDVGHGQHDPGRAATVAKVETAYFAGLATTCGACDPHDAKVAFLAGAEYLVRTTDGGATWSDMTAERVGDAWRGRGYSGLCSMNVRFDPFHKGHAIISAMDAGKCWESRDALATWVFHGSEPWPWGGGNDAVFANGQTCYATTGQFGGSGSVLRTTDGMNWTALTGKTHGLPEFQGQGVATGIYCLPDDAKQVWVVFGGTLYHSSDGGEQWSVALTGRDLGWIAGDPTEAKRFYVSGSETVYVTDDGVRFTPIGGPKANGRMSCDAKGRLYLVAYHGKRPGVWRYAERRWTRLRDDAYAINLASDPADPTRLAVIANDDPYHDACHARGVWISTDDGASFAPLNDGLVELRGHAIAFNPFDHEQLVCGTLGRGFFATRWPTAYRPAGSEHYVASADDTAFAVVDPTIGLPAKIVIRNGGMTQGGEAPAFWDQKWVGRGTITATRDTATFKVGPAALRVSTNGGDGMGSIGQQLNASGGASVAVSGWVKSTGTVKVNVFVQSFGSDWKAIDFKQLAYLQNDSDWREFNAAATLPATAAHATVGMLVEGNGSAWLDEVREAGSPIDGGQASDALNGPPAADKPWVPAWGFYPDFPQAWQATFKSQLDRTREGGIDVVFIGDSITQGWSGEGKELWNQRYAPRKAVNYGIGGDSTRQVLYRLEHGLVDGLTAKLVVLKIGTNNLYGDFNAGSDEEIAKGIAAALAELRKRLPSAKVLLLGILPRQNEYFCGRIARINAIIAKLDDGKTVRFLDLGAHFASAPGKVLPALYGADQLHLVGQGYSAWADAMQPLFDELMK